MMKFSYTSYRQSGVALVVVMIFILILSAIAAFSARRAFLGEGIARSQLDVEIATQAAEAALRDAEIDLRIKDPGLRTGASCDRGESRPIRGATIGNPFFADSCPTGQCRNATGTSHADYAAASNFDAGVNAMPWWPGANGRWNNSFASKAGCTFDGAVPLGTFTGTARIRGVVRQPEYLIEQMQRGREFYFRITARGWGLNPGSEVVLQSFITLGKFPA
jgi:type IV pilus assembly protein PilX